ncbi:hypothetical protein CK203_078854 [Vitis vinifera]|uniref:Uncharacterized protein n=1 Tax=Vitis vinifera TaxID=29760 RepID=A0A438FBV4_VITVI|nr:hypothetical protein CK203_078854 [Vitis vinifera]
MNLIFFVFWLQLGYRRDILIDTFWLMTFFESASFIGSQLLANWLLGSDVKKSVVAPSIASVILAMITIIYITKCWAETPQMAVLRTTKCPSTHIFFVIKGYGYWHVHKLAFISPLQFSDSMGSNSGGTTFSVADGREVHLGLIFPCLLGARMLGSTALPWLTSVPSSLRTEDYLVYAFIIMGLVLYVVAYDYQEIGVLVTLFCLFHACAGLILPSLARLRTMYIKYWNFNSSNASFPCIGRLLSNIGNATIFAFAALGLFGAAGCMHVLKRDRVCDQSPIDGNERTD